MSTLLTMLSFLVCMIRILEKIILNKSSFRNNAPKIKYIQFIASKSLKVYNII